MASAPEAGGLPTGLSDDNRSERATRGRKSNHNKPTAETTAKFKVTSTTVEEKAKERGSLEKHKHAGKESQTMCA